MNCVLFAKMEKVLSLKKNKTLKKYWKMAKNTGKVREFCHSGKVVTLNIPVSCSNMWRLNGKAEKRKIVSCKKL